MDEPFSIAALIVNRQGRALPSFEGSPADEADQSRREKKEDVNSEARRDGLDLG